MGHLVTWAGGEKRKRMSTQDHQQADKWVQRFLILLAERGHKPGFRYGKDLYLDMFDFFKKVSTAVGGSPMDIALRVAVMDLTRSEEEV